MTTPLMGGENPELHHSDFSGITPKPTAAATPNPLAAAATPGGPGSAAGGASVQRGGTKALMGVPSTPSIAGTPSHHAAAGAPTHEAAGEACSPCAPSHHAADEGALCLKLMSDQVGETVCPGVAAVTSVWVPMWGRRGQLDGVLG
ncbi:hypothetical protein DUNSADRAFT_7603 [Dunaliella salina]|uniref:Encoded protein n=1 Tax=Dunaliella salina TaxID=3046 RepID=A0ABQ7GKZ8_DUNSA|nr:hypothetical protein DUNSADRAFT_7603 [Dunaliella salina]|eukprot:KAF5835279.1 hypothetical protein DUNSADRAFT_7603 [Dunaliella salina]